MIRFECDYSEGAHPRILDALIRTNAIQTPGYGMDKYCESASRMICAACANENMDVHFLSGGTQANATVISAALRPHQAALSPETGHIAGHEAGAIEATGHKVFTLPTKTGKISARQIKTALEEHWSDASREHIPQPALVYISQPTEAGTLYSKMELTEISRVCSAAGIYFYIDGARLGYALASDRNDARLKDIASLCDAFTIGGTKVGAMFGEAVCITNPRLREDFRYIIKQRGGMLAKGRFFGVQFETLFRDGLYLEISKSAVKQAMRIKEAFNLAGFSFLYDSFTNQQFPIVNSMVYNELTKIYAVKLWERLEGDRIAIRIVTSWATGDKDVDMLLDDLKRISSLYKTEAAAANPEFFGKPE